MRTISILTLSLGLLVFSSCKQGQISRGDAAYENLAYKKAIKHYEKAIGKKENPRLHAKIAKAYEHMNNTAKAEEHYAMALKDENANADVKLGYAKSLIANGKQEEGLVAMNNYLAQNPEDKNAIEWASKSTKLGEYSEYDPSRIKVEVIPVKDFSGAFSAFPFNDIIYFVGEKDVKSGDVVNPWNGKSFLDIFEMSKNEENEWSEPIAANGNINNILHDGPLTLNKSGEIAYVTQSVLKYNNKKKLDNEGVNQLKISEYKKNENGEWVKTKDLPFNESNSTTMHPSITVDGKTLFFASDRIDGKGGNDIYMTTYDGNNWSQPKNLGTEINTSGNEVFPFANHKDTLFFSSDGHGGMGGLDVFVTIFDGKNWSHPRNLRAPINTNFDDFSLYRSEDGKSGYFSSNRGGKDQIYTWEVNDPQFLVIGKVVDVDNDPVSNATVVLTENGTLKDSVQTGKNGDFSMNLDWEKKYELSGNKKTQVTDTSDLSTVGLTQSDTFEVELRLEAPEFWVKGFVIDKNSKERLTGVDVELLNSADARLNLVKSDAKGEFMFRLDRNEDYNIYGNLKNYFTRKVEVSTMGLKESKTFEVVLELEKVKEMTAIVLNNVYYDYNKWNIRTDALGDLENLLRFMNDNPTVSIEMSSHTDSRGTDKYNMWLSVKRAKSAMDYLIKRGVDSGRMQYNGYGETNLVNECKNGVSCSENKHQENRRTEFKVLRLD